MPLSPDKGIPGIPRIRKTYTVKLPTQSIETADARAILKSTELVELNYPERSYLVCRIELKF
jgi:hypothetical protein